MNWLKSFRRHLIDDIRDAWKFASLWLIAAAGCADLLYDHMPFVQQYMPQGTVSVLAGLALVARLYKQKSLIKASE